MENQLTETLVTRLSLEPTIKLVTPKELKKRILSSSAYKEAASLGLDQMKFGQSLFRELQVTKAIPHLEKANRLLRRAYYDIVDPQLVSDLLLTLAQCYIEKKQATKAHMRLKEVFVRTPRRTFKRDYYSKSFEIALTSALVDFLATSTKENPLVTTDRLAKFAKTLKVDYLVYAYIESTDRGPVVRMAVYDRKNRNTAFRVNYKFTDKKVVLEQLDRMVTQWITCLPLLVDKPGGKTAGNKRSIFLDVDFAYSYFGSDNATSTHFHNLGMGIGMEWNAYKRLSVFAHINFFNSTQDPHRDLRNRFNSYRFLLGGALSYGKSWWRILTRFGWDIHLFHGFETTKDPKCKFYTSVPELAESACAGKKTTFDGDVISGPYISVGMQFIFGQGFFATTRFGVSFYLFPSTATDTLNFPLTTEVGFGYSF